VWPIANAELAKDDEVEVPVQINGKLRGKLKVATGAAQEDLVKLALAEHVIAQHINGKRIVKIVYVPDKLLNLVVS
jgi:leucyl-tRNA synthetase